MPNRNPYDPFRQELQPGRQHQEGGDYGWRSPAEHRSFDDGRRGYDESSHDEPGYGGQGAYGQGRSPGGYGYGLQSGGNREDYVRGGQGGMGPPGGAYGARDRQIHQGRPSYGDDSRSASARRSEARDHDHDPHYQRWHDEQMRAHDNDYARWRGERAEQYHREYNDWRNQRHESFSRDFGDWRTRQGQSAVQDVTDGGDGSSDHDKDDNR